MDGEAAYTVDGIACSSPTAPAMVSRNDSIQDASPSTRAIASRSALAPPNSAGQKATRMPAPIAATGHRVITSTTTPAPMPNRVCRPMSSTSDRALPSASGGFSSKPRIAAMSSTTAPPTRAPTSAISRMVVLKPCSLGMTAAVPHCGTPSLIGATAAVPHCGTPSLIGATAAVPHCGTPRSSAYLRGGSSRSCRPPLVDARLVADLDQVVKARDRRSRLGNPIGAGGEDLAGQHAIVDAVDLPDAVHESAHRSTG